MMYAKLVFRNLKRSTKEYAIYMITLIIAITLMYAFNGVALSPQVNSISKNMDAMLMAVVMSSIVIVFVLGWLIYYISNFILQKRSKEFGMYMLMGMKRKEITRMFLLEQICMGALAFVIGCALGMVAYQIIMAIIMQMFQLPYDLEITFSGKGSAVTFLYLIGIYIVELLRERHYLKKQKIHDLLYNDQKNKRTHHNKYLAILVFLAGFLSFLLGLKECDMAMKGTMETGKYLCFGILFIVLSIFLIFYGLTEVITAFLNRHKSIKYRGNSLYLWAQITTRMQTSRMVLSILSLLTLATLLLVCLGIKFNASFKESEKLVVYDLNATSYSQDKIDKTAIIDYMHKHQISYQDHSYYQYTLAIDASGLLENTTQQASHFEFSYLRYSDYCKLLAMQDRKPKELSANGYLLAGNHEYKETLNQNGKNVQLDHLNYEGIDVREIGQSRYTLFWIIVPDEVLENAQKSSSENYVLKSETPSNQNWVDEITPQFVKENTEYTTLFTKYEWHTENLVMIIAFVFMLLYIAITLACVNATVLAIHQMSDTWKQKQSYKILNKMGVSQREIHRLLRKQIAIYFFIPFLLPMLYVFPVILIADQLFANSYARASMIPYVFASITFYLVIYLCYYFLAYFNSKRSIDI